MPTFEKHCFDVEIALRFGRLSVYVKLQLTWPDLIVTNSSTYIGFVDVLKDNGIRNLPCNFPRLFYYNRNFSFSIWLTRNCPFNNLWHFTWYTLFLSWRVLTSTLGGIIYCFIQHDWVTFENLTRFGIRKIQPILLSFELIISPKKLIVGRWIFIVSCIRSIHRNLFMAGDLLIHEVDMFGCAQ